jgi:hypothetical protein
MRTFAEIIEHATPRRKHELLEWIRDREEQLVATSSGFWRTFHASQLRQINALVDAERSPENHETKALRWAGPCGQTSRQY